MRLAAPSALAATDFGQTTSDVVGVVLAALGLVAAIVVFCALLLALALDVLDDMLEEPQFRRAARVTKRSSVAVAVLALAVVPALTVREMLQDQAADQRVRVALEAKYGVPVGLDQEIPDHGFSEPVLARLDGKVEDCSLRVSGGEPFVFCYTGEDEQERGVEADLASPARS